MNADAKYETSYSGEGGKEALGRDLERADQEREEAVEQAKKQYQNQLNANKNDRKKRVSPWLLIRYTGMDLGLRPLPNGTNFWSSPDIRVESADPSAVNPIANQENFIRTSIINIGEADAAPVKVEFFWADPSLGLSAASWHKIGTPTDAEWVEIKSLEVKEVRYHIPWIPEYINDGHECLLVQCTNYILDPVRYPKEPLLERHVAQKNVHVEKVHAGQTMSLKVHINNAFPFSLNNQVLAKFDRLTFDASRKVTLDHAVLDQAIHFGNTRHTTLEWRDRFHPQSQSYKIAQVFRKLQNRSVALNRQAPLFVRSASGSLPKIASVINDRSYVLYNAEAEKSMGHRLLAHSDLMDRKGFENRENYFLLHSLDMKPFEQRQVEMEVTLPFDARSNEVMTLHLTQETNRFTMGGYTYVFQFIN